VTPPRRNPNKRLQAVTLAVTVVLAVALGGIIYLSVTSLPYLATSPTTEGEATAAYLAAEIRRIAPILRITRIATGVPAGSDIEYADEVTLSRALEGRRDF